MKNLIVIALLLFGLAGASHAQKLKTKLDTASYGLGLIFAQSLEQQDIKEINPDLMVAAIDQYLKGKDLVMDKMEAIREANLYMQSMRDKKYADNKEQGAAFLAKNAKKEDVIVLPSGLQYSVIEKGKGSSPGPKDVVVTHYRGTLIDGTVFDSSYDRGEPATFPVNGVIKGWTEALQLMKPGSKWKLFIPSDLAYGERMVSSKIPPHSTLIFDIELIEVKSKGGE